MSKNNLNISIACFAILAWFNPHLSAEEWYTESLYSDWRQTFLMEEKLYEEKTDEQELVIFTNKTFGKVLVLDGAIQTTENDEFVYHEMIAHVPLLAHGNAKNVLIIGGGDGGALREVLRHQTVEKVILVEIDAAVIAFSKEHLPNHSQGSFEDPRVQIVIQDGSQFVKDTSAKFDVIICDCCDPTGPAAVLYTKQFFGDCKNILNNDGIFVNQNGVPFMQTAELVSTHANLKAHFRDAGFYLGVIPTYVGGFMSFGWASNGSHRQVSIEVLEARLNGIQGELKYYSPAIHKASFVLPKFIETLFKPVAKQLPALLPPQNIENRD